MFQIFGAVTAAIAGVDVLHVYENGVGALNLPYSAAQLGAQATRATNPLTVGMASDLLSEIIGRPFHVTLPHQFETKAEMCSIFHEPSLRPLVGQTISCDQFPQRVAGRPQCGVCPSCLFSRQSLFSAGLREADFAGRFRYDIYALEGEDRIKRTYHVRVMTMQAAALSLAVGAAEPWTALVRQHPILIQVAHGHMMRTAVDPSTKIVSLFRRYTSEWSAFWNEVNHPAAVGA